MIKIFYPLPLQIIKSTFKVVPETPTAAEKGDPSCRTEEIGEKSGSSTKIKLEQRIDCEVRLAG